MKTHYSNDQIEYWTNAAKLEAQDYPNTSISMALTVQNDIIDQLLAEQAKLLAEREWQPISTAPKDGTKIIGAWFDKSGSLRDVTLTWWGDSSRIYDPILGPFKQSEWWLKSTGTGYFDPTHWIPQPPTNEETSA